MVHQLARWSVALAIWVLLAGCTVGDSEPVAAPVSSSESSGQGKQGYFGAQLGPADDGGVLVITVLPDSPALAAGIEPDDVIVALNGEMVADAQALAEQLRQLGAGTEAALTVARFGPDSEVTVRLGENPWQDLLEPESAEGFFAIEEMRDIAYRADADAHDDWHRLDLVRPVSDEPVPVMLWMHGGGWSFGSRADDRALALRFAERGVAFASVSYRLSAQTWADPDGRAQGVSHPAHVNDVADAFAHLHNNAARLGLDSGSMFVSGHSSGAHLAALLASDPRYLEARGLQLADVAGALPVGGAYDIPDYHAALTAGDNPELGEAHIRAVFGQEAEGWIDASPTEYLADSTVPMLVVVEEQAGFQRYAERLMVAAEQAERSNIERLDAVGRVHGNVILMMTRKRPDLVRDRMLEFIAQHGQVPL